MNFSRRASWQVYATGGAACAALSAAAWFFLIAPAWQTRQHIAQIRHELGGRRHKAIVLVAEMKADRTQTKAMQETLAGSRLRLVAASALNDRIAQLNDLATTLGLTIDEIRPGEATIVPEFQIRPLRVSGVGAYPHCAAFLHQLHETYPDITLNSVDISTPANGKPNAPLSFHLELSWYTKR